MSFHASANAQRSEHGLWCALTRLDGFVFPSEPPLAGRQLKEFEKAAIGKASWKRLTQDDLASRVTAIFRAACSVYESKKDPIPNNSFYASVAKISSKTRLRDHNILRQVIGTYVDGMKIAANRSESHIYVDRRSAPAALSVASWIELTEGTIITITTKRPVKIEDGISPQPPSRKRRTEDLNDGHNDDHNHVEAETREAQLKNAMEERDRAIQELGEAKVKIQSLTQEVELAKFKCGTQEVQLRDAKREVKSKNLECRRAEAKRHKFLKAIRTSRLERDEVIVNIKRQYDDQDSEYFALAEARWRDAIKELTLAKQERDHCQRTLADCAGVIKSLNSKLDEENFNA